MLSVVRQTLPSVKAHIEKVLTQIMLRSISTITFWLMDHQDKDRKSNVTNWAYCFLTSSAATFLPTWKSLWLSCQVERAHFDVEVPLPQGWWLLEINFLLPVLISGRWAARVTISEGLTLVCQHFTCLLVSSHCSLQWIADFEGCKI